MISRDLGWSGVLTRRSEIRSSSNNRTLWRSWTNNMREKREGKKYPDTPSPFAETYSLSARSCESVCRIQGKPSTLILLKLSFFRVSKTTNSSNANGEEKKCFAGRWRDLHKFTVGPTKIADKRSFYFGNAPDFQARKSSNHC